MPEDLLSQAAESAFAQLEAVNRSFDRLPVPVQTFVRVYSAQGIIENGGLQYFFESDWEGKPSYLVFSDAYRRIGASEYAEWLDKAIAMFDFPDPHLNAQRRQAKMESLWADEIGDFADLDWRLCSNETIDQLLSQYVLRHREMFAVP